MAKSYKVQFIDEAIKLSPLITVDLEQVNQPELFSRNIQKQLKKANIVEINISRVVDSSVNENIQRAVQYIADFYQQLNQEDALSRAQRQFNESNTEVAITVLLFTEFIGNKMMFDIWTRLLANNLSRQTRQEIATMFGSKLTTTVKDAKQAINDLK